MRLLLCALIEGCSERVEEGFVRGVEEGEEGGLELEGLGVIDDEVGVLALVGGDGLAFQGEVGGDFEAEAGGGLGEGGFGGEG